MRLRGFELIVLLEHCRGVTLRRFEDIELYRALRAIRLVIILNGHRAVAFFDAVKICRQKLCIAADLIALRALLKFCFLHCKLSRNAVARGFDVVAKLLRASAAALKNVAL